MSFFSNRIGRRMIAIGLILFGVLLLVTAGRSYLAVTRGFPRMASEYSVGGQSFSVAVMERPETSFLTHFLRQFTFSRAGTFLYWAEVTRQGSSLSEVIGTRENQPYRELIQIDASKPPRVVVTYSGLEPQEYKSMLLSK